jgi:glycosyltransferase involved in cell wall biosynthesis
MKTSVAVCTFNGEKYISQQLDSILNQTIIPDEIIICDDCSTDQTTYIIQKYILNNKTIKLYINNNNIGTIKNFEKAISLCNGELIFLSDQDDIWYPNKVEKYLYFFNNNKKCLLLFTNGDLIDEYGNNMGTTLFNEFYFPPSIQNKWKNNINAIKYLINNNNKVTGATICIKNQLVTNVLPILVYKGMWHDTWLALHAAKDNGLFFLNDSLIQYRIHNKQQVGINTNNNSFQNGTVSKLEYSFYLRNNFRKYYKYYILYNIYLYIYNKYKSFKRFIKKLLKPNITNTGAFNDK